MPNFSIIPINKDSLMVYQQGVDLPLSLSYEQVVDLLKDASNRVVCANINDFYQFLPAELRGVYPLLDNHLLLLLYGNLCPIGVYHDPHRMFHNLTHIERLYRQDGLILPDAKLVHAYRYHYNLMALSGAKGVYMPDSLLEIRKSIIDSVKDKRFGIRMDLEKTALKQQQLLAHIETMLVRSNDDERTPFRASIQKTGRIGTTHYNFQGLPSQLKKTIFGDKIEMDWSMAELYTLSMVIDRYLPVMPIELFSKIHQGHETGKTLKHRLMNVSDLHQYMSDAIEKKTGKKVSRSIGKKTNFGLNYGLGVDAFYDDLSQEDDQIDLSMVKAIKDIYFENSIDVALFQQWINGSNANKITTSFNRMMTTDGSMPAMVAYSAQGEIADRLSLFVYEARSLLEPVFSHSHFDAVFLHEGSGKGISTIKSLFDQYSPKTDFFALANA